MLLFAKMLLLVAPSFYICLPYISVFQWIVNTHGLPTINKPQNKDLHIAIVPCLPAVPVVAALAALALHLPSSVALSSCFPCPAAL